MLINQEWFQHKGIYNFIITDTLNISYDYLDNDGLVQHMHHPQFECVAINDINDIKELSANNDHIYVLSREAMEASLSSVGFDPRYLMSAFQSIHPIMITKVPGVLIGPPHILQRMWLRFLRNKGITLNKQIPDAPLSLWKQIKNKIRSIFPVNIW
jgi:hypothetical protein